MKTWRLMCLVVMVLIMIVLKSGEGQLAEDFYSKTCPSVENIVQQAVFTKFTQTFVTAQATLRLFFHDCFVQGCDGSIIIQSPDNDAEKDAPDNLSLAGDGFDTVIKAKQAVEAICPGTVSCADILALASRDVVVLTGGPSFKVELGRRDGLRSKASDVKGNLPEPNFDFPQLATLFASRNLTQTDLIALSGAHTIGVSNCARFAHRLYNFSTTHPIDPSLDPAYASSLIQNCPKDVDPSIAISMEPRTPRVFDNLYYQDLVAGRGLFISDQVLFTNPSSKPIVIDFANNAGDFSAAFVTAMRRLGTVGVKTGNEGEIRLDCTTFNS